MPHKHKNRISLQFLEEKQTTIIISMIIINLEKNRKTMIRLAI